MAVGRRASAQRERSAEPSQRHHVACHLVGDGVAVTITQHDAKADGAAGDTDAARAQFARAPGPMDRAGPGDRHGGGDAHLDRAAADVCAIEQHTQQVRPRDAAWTEARVQRLPLGHCLLQLARGDQLFVIVLRPAGPAAAQVERRHLKHQRRRPDRLTDTQHDRGHLTRHARCAEAGDEPSARHAPVVQVS